MTTLLSRNDQLVADRADGTLDLTRLSQAEPAAAMEAAVAARAKGASSPLIHRLVALAHRQSGRFEDAITEAGLGLELWPEDSEAMTIVGFCLLDLDRRQEAAQVFSVASRLDPHSAQAAFGYGWAAERLGALEAAESHFKRAVVLNPNHADALAGLSGLAVRRRDWARAREYAETAAALDSAQTDALMNLARIEVGQGDGVAAEQRLHAILDLPGLHPRARVDCLIMLGDALDGLQRYAEAYECYVAGKSYAREIFAARFAGSDDRPAITSVKAMASEFAATPAGAWNQPAHSPPMSSTRGHAVLLGFPRSGTTLLEQVLATHPDIAPLGERPVLIDAEMEFLTRPGGIERLSATLSEMLEPFRQSYWKRVLDFGVDPRGKVFVDKHPLHTIRLPLISKVFPDAKIIFALRDPRDVVLSCFRRNFNMNSSMYAFTSLEDAADYYSAVMEAAESYFSVLPLKVHRIRYEDVVARFDSSARDLCAFLDVEWTEGLKAFSETAAARMIATPSSTQVGRGLYEEGVGQWRRYAFALKPVMETLQPWIEKFGYDAS